MYERAARGLVRANTQMGLIGNLIHVASILDVYFAMDVHDRFGAARTDPRWQSGDWVSANTSRGPYAERIDAIEAAKRHWQELRATKFILQHLRRR